ncbi:MAG: hypothetical protein ACI4S9_01500 [Christensenellales bacterium]
MKYFIDLDDALVNSTTLNNDAYNFALERFGYGRIITNGRITRELLSDYRNVGDIIELKQKYFTSEWLAFRIVVNDRLLSKIIKFGKANCYIWTKADKIRANKIMEICNLRRFFNDIIFDDKENFVTSTTKLKNIANENKIIIYENNHSFFENHHCRIIDTIQNKA